MCKTVDNIKLCGITRGLYQKELPSKGGDIQQTMNRTGSFGPESFHQLLRLNVRGTV